MCKISSKMFVCRPIQISWEIYKKLKTRFYRFLMFFFWNWNPQFLHLSNTCFCCPGHEQVSLWWINSNLCVGISINLWRCLMILTFSQLHFGKKWEKPSSVHCVHPICQNIVYKNNYKISIHTCTPNYGSLAWKAKKLGKTVQKLYLSKNSVYEN